MKAHNISTKTPLGPSAGASATKESTPAKARATKKRKVQASDDEEDEAPAPVKKEAKVKKETKAKKGAKAKVKEEVKEESEPSDVDDVVEGSFKLSDIPEAPPMLFENDDAGGYGGDGCDVCLVCCSSSPMDQHPTHGHTMPPTPPPPSTHLDSNGAVSSQPLDGVQPLVYEANSVYQSQTSPLPSSLMTRMMSMSPTIDHHQPSDSHFVPWFSQPVQQQNYFWDVVGNGSASAFTEHGHQQREG